MTASDHRGTAQPRSTQLGAFAGRAVRLAWQAGRKASADRISALAAQLAYYWLLATFPALFLVVALVGALPIDGTVAAGLAAADPVVPPELMALLRKQLIAIESGGHAGVLTAGVAGALWTSSVATVAMIDALNTAFAVPERRPWWKRRLVALALTVAMGAFATAALWLGLAGSSAGSWLADRVGIGAAIDKAWRLLRLPLVGMTLMILIDVLFFLAPNRKASGRWPSIGAAVAAACWLFASLAFPIYIRYFGRVAATYGAIGSAAVVLLWYYTSGLALLYGAEINAIREYQQHRPR